MNQLTTSLLARPVGWRPLLLLAAMSPLCVAASDRPRSVRAAKAAGPLKIDGRLDEADWLRATEHGGFLEYSAQESRIAEPATGFKILYDEAALYFACTVREPLMEQLKVSVSDPDADIKVYSDDSIELMLAPDTTGEQYFHFVFNALGNYGDRLMCHGGSAADAAWHALIDSAGTRESDRWVVEARIPFSQIELPKRVSSAWGLQVVRNRRALTGRPIISVFQKCSGGFHNPNQFAEIVGLDVDFRPFMCRVVNFRVQEVGADAARTRVKGEVFVENGTGSFVAFELVGHASTSVAAPIAFATRGGLDHGEVKAFPVVLTVDRAGDYVMAFEVRRLPERSALQTKHLRVAIIDKPLEMVMQKPGYRQTIYPDQTLSQIEIALRSTLPRPGWDGKTLRLSVGSDRGEGELASSTYPGLKTLACSWQLPIPALPEGAYTVRAQILSDGKPETEAALKLSVIRHAPFWYRIDEFGRLLKNGRPLLLVGIEGGFDFEHLAKLGFNYTTLISQYRRTRQELAELVGRASRHGIMVGFNIADRAVKGPLAHQPLTGEWRRKLPQMAALSEGMDAIAMWMLRDEPECRNILPELLDDCYEMLCDIDPLRPVGITNCSHTGLLQYARSADIRRPDPYPGFWQDGSWFSPPTFVSERLDQIFSTPADRQICAMPVLQSFGHGESRPNRSGPAFRDVRNMTWLAVVHGARGMSYYSWNGILGSPGLRVGMPALLKEIRELDAFILAADTLDAKTSSPDVHVLARRMESEIVVCAVNCTETPVEADLLVPALGDRKLVVVSEGRAVQAASDRVHDSFEAVGVHIYSTNPERGEGLDTLAMTQAAIAAEDRRRAKPGNLAFFRRPRKVAVSPNAKIRRSNSPFDGYEEGYGWMPVAANPRDKEPVWMEVELAKPEPVARVRAVVRRIEKYDLNVYDGNAWHKLDVTRQSRRDQQGLCTLSDATAELSPPRTLTKVRFTVPRSTTGNMWDSLQELEVFSAQAAR